MEVMGDLEVDTLVMAVVMEVMGKGLREARGKEQLRGHLKNQKELCMLEEVAG